MTEKFNGPSESLRKEATGRSRAGFAPSTVDSRRLTVGARLSTVGMRAGKPMNHPPVSSNRNARSFHELEVYQDACALDFAIFQHTKLWPKEEMYSLTDQIRRSSRSVGANLAEAWAKRRYPAHFTSKLTDADGELQETQHWIMRAQAYGYTDKGTFCALWDHAQRVGRRLGSTLKSGDWS